MKLSEYREASVSSCLLIISGPDRVGKGWLGERLHKRLMSDYLVLQKPMHLFDPNVDKISAQLFHEDWLRDWRIEMYRLAESHIRRRAEWGWSRIVVDRLYADEWVYSKVFNRPTYTDEEFAALDSAFLRAGAKQLVVVEDDLKVVKKRWGKQERVAFEDYAKLAAKFRSFRRWTSLPCMVVNTQDEDIVERVTRWAFS